METSKRNHNVILKDAKKTFLKFGKKSSLIGEKKRE
jgi:hypothetical protein